MFSWADRAVPLAIGNESDWSLSNFRLAIFPQARMLETFNFV
jgi:hypothetical protein